MKLTMKFLKDFLKIILFCFIIAPLGIFLLVLPGLLVMLFFYALGIKLTSGMWGIIGGLAIPFLFYEHTKIGKKIIDKSYLWFEKFFADVGESKNY